MGDRRVAQRATAVVAAAVVGLGGACQDSPSAGPAGGSGVARVFLTDAPFPYDLVDRVEVYVVEIAASTQPDTGGATQGWVTIAEPRERFDLLALQQGTTTLLGEGQLPAADYRAVRLTLDADSSRVLLRDGRVASVDWQTTVPVFSLHALVESPIGVDSLAGADIVIDFDVGRSFVYGVSFCCDFLFIPWVRAVNAAATGSIVGTVSADVDNDGTVEALDNARITVSYGDPARRETWLDWASGHTDAQGHYRIAYLRAGSYIVEIDAPGRPNIGSRLAFDVPVTPGLETSLSVSLPNGAGIRIQGATYVVRVGATIVLEALVTDPAGVPEPSPQVSWASRNPAVATVESPPDTQTLASIAGVGPGQVYIVATSGSLVDSVQIRSVNDTTGGGGGGIPTDTVASVTVVPEATTLSVGDSTFFQAVLRNASGAVLTGRAVTWVVSDSTVLHLFNHVGEFVAVRPLAIGTVSLTATSEGRAGSAVVQVR